MDITVKHYKGIELSVGKDLDGKYAVYFRNAPRNYTINRAPDPLRGFKSEDQAFEAGQTEVDKHQWEHVRTIEGVIPQDIHVRFAWNGYWGYSIRTVGSSQNQGGYNTKKEAIDAALQTIQERSESK